MIEKQKLFSSFLKKKKKKHATLIQDPLSLSIILKFCVTSQGVKIDSDMSMLPQVNATLKSRFFFQSYLRENIWSRSFTHSSLLELTMQILTFFKLTSLHLTECRKFRMQQHVFSLTDRRSHINPADQITLASCFVAHSVPNLALCLQISS